MSNQLKVINRCSNAAIFLFINFSFFKYRQVLLINLLMTRLNIKTDNTKQD